MLGFKRLGCQINPRTTWFKPEYWHWQVRLGKCINTLQKWKLNHLNRFVPFLAFSLNLVGIQFTSESKLNAFFHEHFNSSCILKAYCWTSKSMYIHALKSWWVSDVLFWEQTHSLKGSSVKYVNPTCSILGPVLCEQNAFVLGIHCCQDQLQRNY